MDQALSVEEMLGLKCPELVVHEVEIETSDSPVEIQSNSTVNSKTTQKKDVPFLESADYMNGALFDELNYCWSQTINEIGERMSAFTQLQRTKQIRNISEIHIRLPENIRQAKHLNVSITASSINIITRPTASIILEGNLYDKCKANDAMWTITSGNKLNLNLGLCKIERGARMLH